jgi:chromosomal replication initiation ATPase DnaA
MTLSHDRPGNSCRPAPRAVADAAVLRRLLAEAAALAFGVPSRKLRARARGPAEVALARQSAMYLAHVLFGLDYRAAGRLFGRDRTTAAHACKRIEDRRDDPAIEWRIDMLETALAEAVREAAVRP